MAFVDLLLAIFFPQALSLEPLTGVSCLVNAACCIHSDCILCMTYTSTVVHLNVGALGGFESWDILLGGSPNHQVNIG